MFSKRVSTRYGGQAHVSGSAGTIRLWQSFPYELARDGDMDMSPAQSRRLRKALKRAERAAR